MDGQRTFVRKQFGSMPTEYQVQFGNEQNLFGIGASQVRLETISVSRLLLEYLLFDVSPSRDHFLSPCDLSYTLPRSLIGTAQSIDPTFCDVHQQYAHVYFQQSKYTHFEEEMVKSLLCPFTMGQTLNSWNKYWKVSSMGGRVQKREKDTKNKWQGYEEVARKEPLWWS